MCLVEVDTGRGPALQPSCMVTVAAGHEGRHRVADGASSAQEGIIELLLANHPLDCPVCDKGGECPLQDQAFSHGPGESRYVEEKRHYEKPIPISDLVLLDRERCILCDRCTRFADEVAGDALIHFTSRGNDTQVNTFPDEPFASYFSGNTVQICPVGALTAKPYRFKARPWDLEQIESTCTTLRRRLPHRRAVEPRRAAALPRRRQRRRSTGAGCATGAASTSRPSTAPTASATPLVRVGDELRADVVERGACRGRRADHARRKAAGGAGSDRRARWRARHERGRLRLGPPGPRRHRHAARRRPARRRCCPIDVLGSAAATIDEAANAATIVLLGAGPQRRAAGAVPAARATPRRSAAAGSSSSPRSAAASAPHAWRRCEYQPGNVSRRRCAQRWPTTRRSPTQLGTGHVVVVAGRANLAEHPREVGNGVVAALQLRAGRQGAAGVAPRQRRRRARSSGLRPGDGGMTRSAILQAAAAGKIELPRAARLPTRWPTSPTPTWPGGRWPARRASSPSTRS